MQHGGPSAVQRGGVHCTEEHWSLGLITKKGDANEHKKESTQKNINLIYEFWGGSGKHVSKKNLSEKIQETTKSWHQGKIWQKMEVK